MAITVNTVVTATSSTNNTTVTVTGVTAAVGDFILVVVAADNAGSGGTATLSSVTDASSNSYSSRYIGTSTNGGNNDGATLGFFTATVTSALSSSDVTVNFSANTRQKRAALYVIEPSSGNSIAERFVDAGFQGDSSDTGVFTTSSVTSGDVVFCAVANEESESISGDSDTDNGAWSSILELSGAGMQLGLQYKITTGTATQYWSSNMSARSEHVLNAIAFYEEEATGVTLALESGSYSVSGASADTQYGRIFAADGSSYSISGTAATLVYAKAVYNDGASYSVSGQTAGLVVGGAPSGFTLGADGGVYTVSGQDITYDRTYVIGAATASYTVSGTAAVFYKGKTAVAEAGSYSVSGAAASFLYGYETAADAGSYSISGTDNNFLKGSTVVAAAGSYSISGQDITMTAGQRRMNVDGGIYEVEGTNAGLFPAPAAGTELIGPDPRITFWSSPDGLVLSYPYGYSFAKYIRRSYNTNGNGNLFVTTAAGSGIFDSRGHLRITIVDGTTYTGIYAADGSVNAIVVDVDDADPDQLFHETGALRISQATIDTPGLINPNNGSLLVANIP